MKTFKQFIEEQKSPSGAEYESIITVGYNQSKPYSLKNAKDKNAFNTVKQFFPDYENEAESLGKTFRGVTKGVMIQYGASKDTTSSLWKQYTGKGKDTPKTDVYTPTHNISLKKKGGGQLMSAASKEAIATVMGALEMTGEKNDEVKKIADDISNNFTKLILDGYIGALVDPSQDKKGQFKDMSDEERKNKIREKIKIDEMHNKLTKDINNVLNKNEVVKQNICYIATTGYQKFPEGSRGIANKLIEFDPKSGKILHNIDTGTPDNISSGIKKMSSATSFYVAFKTGSKNPYSSLRTKTVKFDTMNEVFIETLKKDLNIKKLDESFDNLNEEMIIENLLKRAINKVKDIGGSIKSYFSNFYNKIVEKFKNIINKIIKMGKKAFENLFKFLGIEITNASIKISGVGGGFASK